MPPDPDQIGFLPVEPAHYGLIETWLAQPHMREWWGASEDELRFIRDMVEGRDTTRPFLIALEDVPVGYIQCWFVGHHQNAPWVIENPWLTELPSDAVGVDLSIGCPDRLSQGIGSTALAVFVARLRREGHSTIIIDPKRNNARAIRAYEKAGFRPVAELAGRTGDVLIMQHELNETT